MASTSALHAPLAPPLTEFTDDDLDDAQAWIGPFDQESEEDQSMPPPSQQVCLSPSFLPVLKF